VNFSTDLRFRSPFMLLLGGDCRSTTPKKSRTRRDAFGESHNGKRCSTRDPRQAAKTVVGAGAKSSSPRRRKKRRGSERSFRTGRSAPTATASTIWKPNVRSGRRRRSTPIATINRPYLGHGRPPTSTTRRTGAKGIHQRGGFKRKAEGFAAAEVRYIDAFQRRLFHRQQANDKDRNKKTDAGIWKDPRPRPCPETNPRSEGVPRAVDLELREKTDPAAATEAEAARRPSSSRSSARKPLHPSPFTSSFTCGTATGPRTSRAISFGLPKCGDLLNPGRRPHVGTCRQHTYDKLHPLRGKPAWPHKIEAPARGSTTPPCSATICDALRDLISQFTPIP